MSPKTWGSKSIVKAILSSIWIRVADRAHAWLTSRFVNDVDAMTPTMAAGNTLGLSIETKVQASQVTKLTHRVLKATKRSTSAWTHGNCALNTTVCATVWRKPWSLERQNLVGCKLLLVQGLLLLLQGVDLVLEGDLCIVFGQ
jgi:hypothetical protein